MCEYEIVYPSQTVFSCPVCDLCFSVYPFVIIKHPKIALEGALPRLSAFDGYQFQGGAKLSCLAYADDLYLISHSKQEAQDMVHMAQAWI